MAGSQTILVIALIGLLALLLAWKYKFGKPRSSNSDKKIQQIKFWRKVNEDSGLNVTLIESSSGWQLLDEADASGNGVVTVYGGPGKPTKTMRCYSMVRKSATI